MRSSLVIASAGSGKTYSLTQRFLRLAAQGADPCKILTVTFTRKAAQEMRERIIGSAATLPAASAKNLLAKSHLLSITTMDGLFFDWVKRFPREAARPLAHESPQDMLCFEDDATLLGQYDLFLLNEEALALMPWKDLPEEYDVLSFRRKMLELARFEQSLWLENLALEDLPKENFSWIDAARSLIIGLAESLEDLDLRRKVFDALELSSDRLTEEELVSCGFLTKSSHSVSGRLFPKRAKKTQELLPTIAKIEMLWQQGLLLDLQQTERDLKKSLRHFLSLRKELQRQRKCLTFSDIAQGVYRLFHHPENSGAHLEIQLDIEHLLIDEFQDTSPLQWSIFAQIADELTSGLGISAVAEKPLPSAYFVGDPKQSIYGFRESHPDVMLDPLEYLGTDRLGKEVLTGSWRSAQVVLDFVNAAFANSKLIEFQNHTTAERESGEKAVANAGLIKMLPLAKGANREAAVYAEALAVAQEISDLCREHRIPWSECAILFQQRTHMQAFEEALQEFRVPHFREESRGFFQRLEVEEAMTFLQAIVFEEDAPSRYRAARSIFFEMTDEEILSKAESYEKYLADLLQLRENLRVISASDALYAYFVERDIQKKLIAAWGEFEGSLAWNHLLQWLTLISSLEAECSFLEDLFLALRKHQRANELGSDGEPPQALRLMTIHQAKGLEFEFVVLVDTAEPWGRDDPYFVRLREGAQWNLHYLGSAAERPDIPEVDRLLEVARSEKFMEMERLLYVALTRAKRCLLISGNRARERKVPQTVRLVVYDRLLQAFISLNGGENKESAPVAEALSYKTGDYSASR